MNRHQTTLRLLSVTLRRSAEAILRTRIPDGVPAFATAALGT